MLLLLWQEYETRSGRVRQSQIHSIRAPGKWWRTMLPGYRR